MFWFAAILPSTVIVIVTTIYGYFKWQYRYWVRHGIPHLEPVFPFGSLRRTGKHRHMKDTFDETYFAFKGQAPYAGMFFFTQPVVLAIDLDFINDILVKDFNQFHDRGMFYNERDDPLSANLVTLRGQKWKAMRAKLTPTFTSGKMKFMYPIMLNVMKQFDEALKEMLKNGEGVFEIKDLLARFTTDVIGVCAFGIECNSLKDPNAEFRQAGRMVFENPKLGQMGRAFIAQFPKLATKFGMKTTRDDVATFFMKVVRETVEFREKNNVRRNDFMDLLIQLKNGTGVENEAEMNGVLGKLSVEQVAAQAFIFFLAGFETSSTTMSYSLYELAMLPEMQEKARREIDQVLEKHDGEFTYVAMLDMNYIDRIINETLRKYPPVINLFRAANANYSVPNTDKVIEKDTRIFIPIYSIHHDPDIYPNPDIFDPDRFAPEAVRKRHPMAFLGFGDGPRNCIGLRFALMQSRIGLVSLLSNYRFSVCDKTPKHLEYSILNPILTPEGGLWLKMEAVE